MKEEKDKIADLQENKNRNGIKEKELEKKEEQEGLCFIGYIDLPEKYKSDIYQKNIGLSLFTVGYRGFEFDVESALREKRDSKSTTTRVIIKNDFTQYWASLNEEYRGVYNKSDLIWLALKEIEINKGKRYF